LTKDGVATVVTEIQNSQMYKAARELRGLVSDETLAAFDGLDTDKPEGGLPTFDAAKWLDDAVLDRRHGLIHHVHVLRDTFEGLATALEDVAGGITETDTAGGESVQSTNSGQLRTTPDTLQDVRPEAVSGVDRKLHDMADHPDYVAGQLESPDIVGAGKLR
jgi:hypothetical protein